jgi:P27 family predicted phage terminase small subunit
MARGRKPSPRGLADKPGAGGQGGAPEPPDGMSAAAVAKWRALVPLIGELVPLRETDVDALRSFCEAAARRDRANREMESAPLVIETPNGAMQINPLITIAERAEAAMMRLAERFGLDPASRKRLQLASKKGASPFADFLRKKPT